MGKAKPILADAVHGAAQSREPREPSPRAEPKASPTPPTRYTRAPSREGKHGIVIHVGPELRRKLKLMAVYRDCSVQTLGIEALERFVTSSESEQ